MTKQYYRDYRNAIGRNYPPEHFIAERKELGLTQAELAEHLGVSRSAVVRWENGKRSIPPFMGLALKGLDISLNYRKI